jgi:chorismate synthase
VAAGAIAEKCLHLIHKTEIIAFVESVGPIKLFQEDAKYPSKSANPEFTQLIDTITRDKIDTFVTRCPNEAVSKQMEDLIVKYKNENDSIGGTVTCVIRNCPIGLGEPAFDKLEAKLAHAMLSIPATKGFEIGSGFAGTQLPGSTHNDPWVSKTKDANGVSGGKEVLGTTTNHSGGIQGGISNGENIYFTVAFKSPATISQAQHTATYDGKDGTLEAKGRHDPCVVPRAVPIVEAMAALTLMDAFLAQAAKKSTSDLIVEAQSTEMEI